MRNVLVLVALVACKSAEPEDLGPFEGDDPGECTDGADNDRDGAFDCFDRDCEFSPACTGEGDADADADSDADADTDADADSDADADTDTDTDVDTSACSNDLCGLTSVSITYSYQLTVVGLGSCTQNFVGSGNLVAGQGDWVRFEGSWERTSSTCAPQFDDIIWFEANGEGYHTFVLHPNRNEVLEWYAHRSSTDHTSGSLRFFITEMYETIDLTQPSPAFTHVLSDGDSFTSGDHDLSVTFN